jgi:hypothetical protein
MAETIWDASARIPERMDVTWKQEGNKVTVRRLRLGPARRAVVRVFGIPGELTVHLDALGSEVWLLIDGRRTVAGIRAELAKTHPGESDLTPRLGKFLGEMASRGFVRLR